MQIGRRLAVIVVLAWGLVLLASSSYWIAASNPFSSRSTDDPRWQMIRLMGRRIDRTTTLVLRDEASEVITTKDVKMTEENRRKIVAASSTSLPDLQEIIERLKQHEKAFGFVTVKLTHSRLIRFMQPADQPLLGFFVGTWYFDSNDRVRYDGIVEETTTSRTKSR